jgi:hypothetical protein
MIFASLGLDWSNFQRGIQGAITSVQRLAGGASLFATASAAARQFVDAIEMGDALVDLNAQTGVAIDKLMELQMAFDLNGMKAEQVQPVLSKMQLMIADAGSGSSEAAAKFAMMGMSIADIQGLNADEQLMEIGKAIKEIQNPAQRSAMAMEIFGKQGAKLLSVFAAGGMEEVRKVLGNQSAILLENAGIFGKASDILGLTGSKVRGFFVGIASEIVPQLMKVLEKSAKLDFSKVGQGVGKEINMFVAAAQEVYVWMAKLADLIVSAFSKAAQILLAPALFLGKVLGGDRGPSGQQEGAPETKDTYLSRAMAQIEEEQKKARADNKTPGAADTGAGYIPKAGGGGGPAAMIATSGAKVGALGGAVWGGEESINVQRDQLAVQQRIANSIDAFLKAATPDSNPYIGSVMPQLGVI